LGVPIVLAFVHVPVHVEVHERARSLPPDLGRAPPVGASPTPRYARIEGGPVPVTEAEVGAILDDASKAIASDIRWSEDEDHWPAVEFRADVTSAAGHPLVVCGSHNPLAKATTFALIHRGAGRIYALDLGKDHHNPTCVNVGEKHKHRWTERFGDKEAYVPADVSAEPTDPVLAWHQFCAEAKITHQGTMSPPPPHQESLFR
jgi:hypothetical protein